MKHSDWLKEVGWIGQSENSEYSQRKPLCFEAKGKILDSQSNVGKQGVLKAELLITMNWSFLFAVKQWTIWKKTLIRILFNFI